MADLGPSVPLTSLVDTLGGHPNATRQHLDGLIEGGYVSSAPLQSGGRGRPAQGFTITSAGRRALAGDAAPAAHAQLIEAIALHLSAIPEASDIAEQIGHSWGERRNDDTVTGALEELGFAPVVDADDPEVTRLLACPMLDAARDYPEVICAIHRGFVKGMRGTETQVTLQPFAEPGACRLRVAG